MGKNDLIGGRPTKLTPELKEKAKGYIFPAPNGDVGWKEEESVIPTVEGFASYLGISRDTAYAWCEIDNDFSDILTEIKSKQGKMLINKSLEGKYNSTIAKLILSSKHGYVEKTAQDVTTGGDKINTGIDPTLATEFTAFLKGKTKQ